MSVQIQQFLVENKIQISNINILFELFIIIFMKWKNQNLYC